MARFSKIFGKIYVSYGDYTYCVHRAQKTNEKIVFGHIFGWVKFPKFTLFSSIEVYFIESVFFLLYYSWKIFILMVE